MTKEEFLSLIRSPDDVIHQRTEALSGLVKEFPYCQALRYFYLLQLHHQNHISYSQQLKLSSAYAPDRKRLHQLIHPQLAAHDSVAWNENIALEDEGLIDTSLEKTSDSTAFAPTADDQHIAPAEEIQEISVYEEDKTPPIQLTEEDSSAPVKEEEDALSAEEIVIQRLKELNIWTEPASKIPVVEVNIPADPEDTEDDEPDDEIVAPEAVDSAPNFEAAKREEEEIQVSASAHSVADEVIDENVNAEIDEDVEEEMDEIAVIASSNDTSPASEITALDSSNAKELDPLEELILENLVATEINNTAYFSEESISAEDELNKIESVSAPALPTSAQPGEVHSFSEWLHLNQRVIPSKVSEPDSIPTIVPQEEEKIVKRTFEPNDTLPTPVKEEPTISHHPAPTVKMEAPLQKQEMEAPKMVYVKATLLPDESVSQKEVHTPMDPSISHEHPSFHPMAITPLNEDVDLIPPKKPIPDPSLVDTDPPKSKVPADQLIDKFIKQEPRITPSKSAFYSPVNMAKRSIIESDDLVSETLANIYAQQGNFAKAISFYTKLSLRFPEKSRYFAALIKELENKLNT